MKAKQVSMFCVRSALLGGGVVGVVSAAASCSDVPIDCTVGRGDFNVQFITDDPACDLGNGDVIGAQAYIGRGSNIIGGAPEPDLKQASMALQSTKSGAASYQAEPRAAANLQGTPYAYGPFGTPRPDGSNFCTVSSMTSHVTAAAVTAEAMDNPDTPEDETVGVSPVDLTYAWSNVRFYVTPGIQGLQWEADLAYSNAFGSDTGTACSVSTKAVGVFPYFGSCVSTTVTEGLALPTDTEPQEFVTGFAVDDTYCGNIKMSGVSSDYPVKCVPATAPEYQSALYVCDPTTTVCTPDPGGATVPNNGFCFLEGAGSRPLPIVK